ncbi:TPA: ImmA/IrrE family metallo-endopeptidase [Klebsiella variicola subsp. variicola]|uniref:ImmA/IrrE family metallo-endopeptidase n=1 Tax=Klebsiella/Raoultella group TaxID=2890311 RepID=UPI0010331383|nr:ImmA/IrrE family metallo-endopeptidase [Klebsiella pneumoniae]HCI6825272.1 ImmA/IrrE family metallo-endopeptidase [Klebsiella variicola subsp. variicola]
MTNHNQMSRIYSKFGRAGFNLSYIRKLLPEWWDEQLAETPSGRQYACLHLARMFSILPDSLKDDSEGLCFNFGGNHKYKHRQNVAEQDLDIATAVAYAAAGIVASNFKTPFDAGAVLDPTVIRDQILAHEQWVSLGSLVTFCHSIGIPVVYLKYFPQAAKKMAGLALVSRGRPVIVLTQPQKYGYMLFDLAHELGHIAKGHLNAENGQCHVDLKIENASTDLIEKEANEFAFQVISGQKSLRIGPTGGRLKGSDLARAAHRYGSENHIDPTHIALNYGYAQACWGAAVNAVKLLCAGKHSDQDFVRAMMKSGMDLENIHEDDLKVLENLIGE